jgi:hypothetical protein
MGAYNVLKVRDRCSSCGQEVDLRLQFKYGDTWQVEYAVGDQLKWGGNDVGRPGAERVVLDAPAEPCPRCGFEGDFEIFVEGDRIQRFRPSSGQYDFAGHRESFILLEPSKEAPSKVWK